MYHIQVIGHERFTHYTFTGSEKNVISKAYALARVGDSVTIEADDGTPITNFKVSK